MILEAILKLKHLIRDLD